MERGQVKARVRIARSQSRRAREILESLVERLVPLEQYSQIEIGFEIVWVVSQLAFEGARRAIAVAQTHQSPPVPGLQARQLRIQFERALEFLHGRMLIVRQQQDGSDEQSRLGRVLTAEDAVNQGLSLRYLVIADQRVTEQVSESPVVAVVRFQWREQLDDLFVLAQPDLTIGQN